MAVADQLVTDRYAVFNGDSCEVLPTLPTASAHLAVYSPPFAVEEGGCLYTYSSSERDLSNARTYDEFFRHYEFVVRELHRILLPGRVCAVHCMDVPKDGANICGYTDFPGDLIRLHERVGFEYTPRICIWKEPLEVRNRTMSKALAHRTICEDATRVNVAAADYLIPFRKKGRNPVPVTHPTGLHRYVGTTPVPADVLKYRGYAGKQTENKFSHFVWRNYASPHWLDIDLGRVLPYREARDAEDEKHVHPLQLDVVERCVEMWTNPGETVLTPFMGVGSEVYGAVINGRRGVGVELKASYYRQAVRNLAEAKPVAEEAAPVVDLFSHVEGTDSFIVEPDQPAAEVPATPAAPVRVYADGGVVGVNPSPAGGTWAWCHVGDAGLANEGSGFVRPDQFDMPTVSNNLTEFLALLHGMEALPDGADCEAYTDSGVTLMRFAQPETVSMRGIPAGLVDRLRTVRGRLGKIGLTLLGGHPTKKDLAAGFRKDGKPVSEWNVWCDKECGRQAVLCQQETPATVPA